MARKYATAVTIGCRLNQADTALIFDKLKNMGYEIVKPNAGHPLSIIVINTCSVTASASQKSRQAARSIKKKNPEAIVVVTGCGADIETDFWNEEQAVDLVIPNSSKTKIEKYLGKLENRIKSTNTTDESDSFIENAIGYYPFKSRANIKIQEGCDCFCTYCIVPYGRGKPRSRNWNDTIREFKELINRGHKEIVLTGVNIATYNDNGKNILALIKELANIEGDFRIRLSSTEPQFNTHELIDVIASSPKICRFLHLPLQHGTNEILKRMGRKYTTQDFAEFVLKAEKQIPDICIGTDVIVGFPGETEELFNNCADFIKQMPLSYLHVFRYSKREGTPAADYPDQVPHNISLKRHKKLSEIGKELSDKLISKQLNKSVKVLFEKHTSNNELVGWSDNYIKVRVRVNDAMADKWFNNFTKVKITKIIGQREAEGIII